jgi:hypothetical protein
MLEASALDIGFMPSSFVAIVTAAAMANEKTPVAILGKGENISGSF